MLVAELVLGAFDHFEVGVVPVALVGNDAGPAVWRKLVQSATTDYGISVVSERRTVEVDDLVLVDVDAVMHVREQADGPSCADVVARSHVRRAENL